MQQDKKGCSYKPECDCTLGGKACIQRLLGKGPVSNQQCHPPKRVLEAAVMKMENRQPSSATIMKGAEVVIYWSTHRM